MALEHSKSNTGYGVQRRKKAIMAKESAEVTLAAWLTYTEAQQYASLGRTTLTALVTSGAVPAAKVGKAVRISKAGLDEFMQRNAYTETAHD
jgi:excisionase family DNA binding protein